MSIDTTQSIDAEEGLDLVAERPEADVRVNLLPRSVIERQNERRARTMACAIMGTSVFVAGGLWILANQSVGSAQEAVDSAQFQQSQLQAEMARYSDVPRVFGAVERAETELQTAMAKDVRWSYVLNDLSLITPQGVALTNMSVTLADGTPGPTTATPSAPGQTPGAAVAGPIAKVQWSGEATSFNGIATWLDALAKLPTYSNPYFTQSTRQGAQGVVTFSSTADITDAALSHRFDKETAK